MSGKPTLTPWELFTLYVALLRVLFAAFFTVICAPFRGSNTSKKLKNHVILAMLRTLTENGSGRQLSYIQPTIHESYLVHAKKEGFEPTWETLPSGNRAYWVGDPKAEKTLVYYHGGGYKVPPGPNYFPFFSLLASRTSNLSILVPEYTLAWSSPYPTQLREAVETLSHILHTLRKPPLKVSLGGDSAGGHLILGVLSHLLHPHPDVPSLKIDEPLAGAVLVSAWASFRTDFPSMHRNRLKDLLNAHINVNWSREYLDSKPTDAYNSPLTAGEGWWEGLEGVVREILITAGEEEILVDCIKELDGRLRAKHSRVTLIVAEGEWHVNPLLKHPPDEIGISRDAIIAFCNWRL